MSKLEKLTLEERGKALTFDSIEGQDGKRRMLVVTTTPEGGSLPLLALDRDTAFRALEWIGRWLQQTE